MNKTTPALILLALVCLVSAPLRADIPAFAPGERVIFSDDFIDNRNKWSGVAVTNNTGKPASTQAVITKSEWGPSMADSQGIASTHELRAPVKLKDGPINLYMHVRVDDAEGTDGNRFAITLSEPAGMKGFIRLLIRPATNGFIEYRDALGAGQSKPIDSAREVIRTSSSARTFKLTLTPGLGGRGSGTAEAFYLDPKTRKYVSLGTTETEITLTAGELPLLGINNRNGENGAVWFDSVAVTQGPLRR